MNKEMKEKWVKALRSGDFVQGRGVFKQYDFAQPDGGFCYCCLGVLCELEGRLKEDRSKNWYSDFPTPSGGCFCNGEEAIFGLANEQVEALIDMNDRDEKTFPEIADWIEANL